MSESAQVPAGVDHLIFVVPDLSAGCDRIERSLGTRPAIGGRHPDYGTHNALLSLGPATYLEVMAADRESAPPARGTLFGADRTVECRLETWVLRAEDIQQAADRACAAGVDLGPVSEGAREMPDGSVVSWMLTDPYADRMEGLVPFLIRWGQTPHPGGTAPVGGTLVGLRAEHPRPEEVRSALAAVGVKLEVGPGPAPLLVADIATARGVVQLR